MAPSVSMEELMQYTSWEREKWHAFLTKHGEDALKLSAGPNGDGRITTAGDVVKHIFGAELRYVQRLTGQPVSDLADHSTTDVEELFQLAKRSRQALRELLPTIQDWDQPRELKILEYTVHASPRKIVTHVLLHEIRHWAQLATLWRLNGMREEFHDFLFAPAMV